jgi:hypothetical protein
MSAWGLDIGEKGIKQIDNHLVIRYGLVFRDREPF